MKAGGAVVCACLVAALLAGPAPAADGGRGDREPVEVQPPTTSATALLEGSNGYLLGLEVPHPRVAILYAVRLDFDPDFQLSVAAYAKRIRPTGRNGVIEVRFGEVASASLRFVPSEDRPTRRSQLGCERHRKLIQQGHFRGRIEVRGEDGYTRASARRVSGRLESTLRMRCRPGFAHRPDPRLTSYLLPLNTSLSSRYNARLEAVSDAGGRTVAVVASHQDGSGSGASVDATASEWKDRMLIFRGVGVEGGVGTLLTSLPGAHPATATLKPPRPFRGKATFLELSPTSHRWSGSLAVRLPGLEVPLTGPDFATGLCVSSRLRNPDGCSPLDPQPVVPERLLHLIGRRR